MNQINLSQPVIPHEPAPISKTKLLVGEGSDEVKVFTKLLETLGIIDVQVEACESKNKLGRYLKGLRGRSGFRHLQALGIIGDSDDDATAALDRIANFLKGNGLATVRRSGEITADAPTVGVLVIGDGKKTKMLEDLCLASTIDQQLVWDYLDSYFSCLEKAERLPSNLSKARLGVWLAVQRDANTRGLGGAAEKKSPPLFDWNSRAFDEIKDFFSRLFAAQPASSELRNEP